MLPPSATPPALVTLRPRHPLHLPCPRPPPPQHPPRRSRPPQTRTITLWKAVTISSPKAPNQQPSRPRRAPYTAWRPPFDLTPSSTRHHHFSTRQQRAQLRRRERTLREETKGREESGVLCELGLGWTNRTANIQRNVRLGVDALVFFYFWFLLIPRCNTRTLSPPLPSW